MTKAISSSSENLNSIANYSPALQNVQKIEKAVSLAEQGKPVVDFKRYTDAFTTLVEKMNARTAKGRIAPEHFKTHKELDPALQGLKKRIEVIESGKITPPTPASKRSSWTNGWSLTKVATYTVLGGAAIYNAPQLWEIAKQVLTVIKVGVSAVQQIPEFFGTVIDISKTVIDTTRKAGEVLSTVREKVNNLTGIKTLDQGTTPEQHIATAFNLVVQGLSASAVLSGLKPLLPSQIFDSITFATTGAVLGNNIVTDFTQKTSSIIEQITSWLNEHPAAGALGSLGVYQYGSGVVRTLSSPSLVTIGGFFGACYYGDKFLNGTISQSVGDFLRNGGFNNTINLIADDLEHGYLADAVDFVKNSPEAQSGIVAGGMTIAGMMRKVEVAADLKALIDKHKTTMDVLNIFNEANIRTSGSIGRTSIVSANRAITSTLKAVETAHNSADLIRGQSFHERAKPIVLWAAVYAILYNCANPGSYCQDVAKDAYGNPWITGATAISTIAAPILWTLGTLTAWPAAALTVAVPMLGHSFAREDGYGRALVKLANSHVIQPINTNALQPIIRAVNGLSTSAKIGGGAVGAVGGAVKASTWTAGKVRTFTEMSSFLPTANNQWIQAANNQWIQETVKTANPLNARKITLVALAGFAGLAAGGFGFAVVGGLGYMAWSSFPSSDKPPQTA